MKLKKDILDYKKPSKHSVDTSDLEQQKAEIWKTIQKDRNKTRIFSIQKAASFVAIAAGITLILIFWFNRDPQIDLSYQMQAINTNLDTSSRTQIDHLATTIEVEETESYLAESTSLEEIESAYVSQIENQDTTLNYEAYLISEGIDETLIIDELL